jgi:hypothetical protein
MQTSFRSAWLVVVAALLVPGTVQSGNKIDTAQLQANFDALKKYAEGLEARLAAVEGKLIHKMDKPQTGAFAITRTGQYASAVVAGACEKANCDVLVAFTPSGGVVKSIHKAVGSYQVMLPTTSTSTLLVAPYGFGAKYCSASAAPSSSGGGILVQCFGPTGAALDTAFSVASIN